jgi:energy-coupling factor transporter ATP-binding protein EcfA2
MGILVVIAIYGLAFGVIILISRLQRTESKETREYPRQCQREQQEPNVPWEKKCITVNEGAEEQLYQPEILDDAPPTPTHDPTPTMSGPVCETEYLITKPYCPTCGNPPTAPRKSRRPSETFGLAALRATRIVKRPVINPKLERTLIPQEKLTKEQRDVINEIDGDAPVILVTGKAGTGKSTLIEHIRGTIKMETVTVAFTGVAAIIIHGQTIHSFFRFPHEPITENLVRTESTKQRLDLLDRLELLIIDEISMVRADLLDGINWYLRINRRGKSHLPFGGVKILMLGDPFQLAPFASSRNGEQQALQNLYKEFFFFNALSLQDSPYPHIQLSHVFRQRDKLFIALLNRIRKGIDTAFAISGINNACKILPHPPEDRICLTTKRDRAQQINESRLAAISGRQYKSTAIYIGTFRRPDGDEEKDFQLPAPDPLLLKVGAKIMLLKNDKDNRWVNGSIGIVEAIDPENNLVQVRLDENGRIINAEKETWEKLRFFFNEDTGGIDSEVVGSFTQYPITHAWAATIHKAQGQTLEKIHVDLASGAFAEGQTYVALSRCPQLENITLARPLRESEIKVSSTITRFMSSKP